ncbi:eCIS core domain-containing protein [Paenibacillus agricola]|uniref:DUF4157 domain-containing protein n=1 Tax=Paenibacillus agricola TaxID=2716264 RepID=A0ABX0JCB5_9BACL|nr:DUF4157 domain-containing protein [Paenibacillus agricola]NHN32398.1 DUF4157 domain-containing protein [Paenibacillus agricola]
MHSHQSRNSQTLSSAAALQRRAAASKETVAASSQSPLETAAGMMSLQGTIGNRGVQRMLSNESGGKLPIQAKMTVGPVGDQYEQEADKMAGQVVQQLQMRQSGAIQREAEGGEMEEEELQMKPAAGAIQREAEGGEMEEEELQMKPAAGAIQRMAGGEEEELQMKPAAGAIQREAGGEEEELQMKPAAGAIQREAEGGEMEEEELQMKPAAGAIQREAEGGEMEEEELQMKPAAGAIQREAEGGEMEEEELQMKPAGGSGFDVAPSIEQRIQAKSGGGSKMDGGTLSGMNEAFGADFGGVSIHNDAESSQISDSIGAQAFTQGKDVFFAGGKYDPGSQSGQELLAHELTHVVQQTGGQTS